MDVLDSSHLKAEGVKSPGLKKIFLIFTDTLLSRLLLSCYEGAMISSILHCQANINTHTNMLKTPIQMFWRIQILYCQESASTMTNTNHVPTPQAKNKGITPIWYLYAMASVQLLQVANSSYKGFIYLIGGFLCSARALILGGAYILWEGFAFCAKGLYFVHTRGLHFVGEDCILCKRFVFWWGLYFVGGVCILCKGFVFCVRGSYFWEGFIFCDNGFQKISAIWGAYKGAKFHTWEGLTHPWGVYKTRLLLLSHLS